jgi:hypothetical protein
LYACDFQWWSKYQHLWKSFHGQKYTWSQEAAKKFGLTHVLSRNDIGLGLDAIHTGGNSGYQAVNLAFIMGAKKIILLGFDMQRTGGKMHFHGDHKEMNNPNDGLFRQWVQNFNLMAVDLDAAGVEVLNATRETALTCFPRVSISDI